MQRLAREAAPRNAVEVGTMCGYSTILMAQALPKGVSHGSPDGMGCKRTVRAS